MDKNQNIDLLQKELQTLSGENEALLERYKREALEKELLLEISKRISSSLSLKEVLELIIDSVKLVIPYDAAGIFLVNPETEKIYPAVLRGYDRQAIKRAQLKVGRGLIGIVAREGKGLVASDVSKEPRYVNARNQTRSEIIVPLKIRNKLLGALNLESDKLHGFTESQLDLLNAFASHAALAIDNARLHEEEVKNRELEYDLRVARKIQRALLPKVAPKVNGFEFASINIPSKTVSGDLYDYSWLSSHRLAFAIGDVSGKGTPAAILMASMYTSYKRVIHENRAIAEKISRLNRIICETIMEGTYITLFYAEMDVTNKHLLYCNAGHFPPVIVHKDGAWEKLDDGGTILGFIKDAPYHHEFIQLKEGDILFLYTDGVIEARNRKNEFFGLERVVNFLHENSDLAAKKIKENLLKSIKRFTGSNQFDDDLTFIVIKVKG